MKPSLHTIQVQCRNFTTQVKKRSWKDISQQKAFLDELSQKLNIKQKSDWYNVRAYDVKASAKYPFIKVKENGGESLITNKYGGSLVKALMAIYPEYEWKPWKFIGKIESEFWNSYENQKRFLDDFASYKQIKDEEGWYIVSKEDIINYGGGGLLQMYKNSLPELLSKVYKDKEWKEYRFSGKQDNWTDRNNHRLFFDDLAKKLNVKTMEDWYSVKHSDIVKHKGNGLLQNYYDHSLTKALTSIYKEYNWQLWRFEKVPKHYWDDFANVKKAFNWLSNKLEISDLDDWYSISVVQLHALGCGNMLEKYGGFLPLLKKVYPDHNWSKRKEISLPSSKSQFALFRIVRETFPNSTDIYLDYPHPHLIFSDSKRSMEFDVIIPSLKLAFELQGGQHYDFHYLFGSPSETQRRDQEKREACERAGITLIEVPYWWDHSKSSLIATIHKYRSDLFKDSTISTSSAIPTSVSKRKPKETDVIPFDEMPLYDPMKWEDSLFEKSAYWYLFHRKNGVRVYWNGKSLFLRSGKRTMSPSLFLAKLPSIPLDGELWSEDPSILDEIVTSSDETEKDIWEKVHFDIFDLPNHNLLRFEERLQLLKQSVRENEFIHVANYTKCYKKEELLDKANQLKNEISKKQNSLESIILTVPTSFYRSPFSSFYIKEVGYALVVEYLGSQIKCQLPSGKEFLLEIEGKKPELGAVISIKYASLSSDGKPILPHFIKQRKDIQWKQILFESNEKDELPYVLSYGKSVGIVPSCRGCLRPFNDRNELRIVTNALFSPPDSSPVQGKVNFCINLSCIQKAIHGYASIGIHLPEFKAQVRVPPSLTLSNIPSNFPFKLSFDAQ